MYFWYILCSFGKFYPVLVFCTKKNLATLNLLRTLNRNCCSIIDESGCSRTLHLFNEICPRNLWGGAAIDWIITSDVGDEWVDFCQNFFRCYVSMSTSVMSTSKVSTSAMFTSEMSTYKMSTVKMSNVKMSTAKMSTVEMSTVTMSTVKLLTVKMSTVKMLTVKMLTVKMLTV
jgi:hypothetical protein